MERKMLTENDFNFREDGSFYYNGKDPHIDIPAYIQNKKITNISKVFEGNPHIKSVKLHDEIEIMDRAFAHCYNLVAISHLPKNLISMEEAFWGCWALASVPDIPEGILSLYRSFRDCRSIEYLPKLPSSLLSLREAFMDCKGLFVADKIPDSVMDMRDAFLGCINLVESKGISKSTVSMHGAFQNCINLIKAPNIPRGVIYMGKAFAFCYSISCEMKIDANPKEYENCFYDAAIKESCGVFLKGRSPVLKEFQLEQRFGDDNVFYL